MSRPSRFGRRSCAHLIVIAGSSPAMTSENKKPRLGPRLSYLRTEAGSAAEEACRDLAVNLDQRQQVVRLRIDLRAHRLLADEDAEIGDVLPDRGVERIVFVGHCRQEQRPELAVVSERVLQRLAGGIFGGLQPRSGV